nr:uncharacterized protein LOC111422821 [Onthophagus taurus]
MRSKLIVLTVSLTIISVAVFVSCLVHEVYFAASWIFITGILNFLTSHIIFLKLRQRLNQWYGLPELESFYRLGIVFMGFSVAGVVYHFVYFILHMYHFSNADITIWLPIFFALSSTLSAFLLCYWSDHEQREL